MGSRTCRGLAGWWLLTLIAAMSEAAEFDGSRPGSPPTGSAVGVAVLGDSYSDEYAPESDVRSHARNWVEILARTRGLDFGTYSGESRGEPRRAGYAHVWARSAATTADLLAQGQHRGAAAQAAEGLVAVAVVFIGGNDFIDWLEAAEPSKTIDEVSAQACANVDETIRVLLAASPGLRVVLVTVPDLFELPELSSLAREGRIASHRVEASRAGLSRFNAHLLAWPRREARVSAADFAGISRLGSLLAARSIPVGSVRLRRDASGLERDAAFLPDGRHAGTLLQGVLAQIVLQAIDRQVLTPLPPLSGGEIVSLADAIARENEPGPSPTMTGGSVLIRAADAP